MPDAARTGERIFRGIPVSPGVCRGKILLLGKPHAEGLSRRHIQESEVPAELKRFEQALVDTRHQILGVQRQVTEGLGANDAAIFDAHLLVLEDPVLIEEVSKIVRQDKVSAEYAFQQVAEKYSRTLSAIDDEYLRERAADMRDVTTRMLDNLTGRTSNLDLTQPDRALHHHQLRSHAVSDRTDRQEDGAWVCHRRRQPHRIPPSMALDAHPGGGRAATRQPRPGLRLLCPARWPQWADRRQPDRSNPVRVRPSIILRKRVTLEEKLRGIPSTSRR